MVFLLFLYVAFIIDSDDNSSIQSSPWQRDHCWKQSRPRHNISKEMAFFYSRPTRLYLSQECRKIAKSMRRQPLHKNGKINFKERKKKEEENGTAVAVKEEPKTLNESSSDEKGSSNDSKESIDTLDGSGSKESRIDKRKLSKIVKKLSERMASKLALNGNGANGHHHHASTAVIPTSYSLASHIANSINSQSAHQHVSPRKRILRELEKVTLEDTKRSRPKSVTTNGTSNITHPPQQSTSIVTANGSLTKNNEKTSQPPASSSRPISSYSITSLLAHNTSSSSSSSSNASMHSSSISTTTAHNDSSLTTSHHQSYQSSRLHSPPKSPLHKRKSPHMQSPIQSPSPEHHAFHKYRPVNTTPTPQAPMPPTSSSSPYNSSYPSPSYMRGSPSPSDALNSRLRTTGNFQHSPSHHYGGTSSSPSNYVPTRDSSLSPNVEKASSRSTPTTPAGIRTVPKKTAALRQQFNSPTMNESSNKPKASPNIKNEVKPMDVDALMRPSALIPPIAPGPAIGHPAALSHYPYMYSPLSYLPPPAVPPYYHPFYNPAMMAAAAAAYRFPMPGYPGAHPSMSPIAQQQPPVTYADSKTTTNGQQRNSSSLITSSPPPQHTLHHPAYTSPWNPIPMTNHSINDGNLIPKVKDEPPSSGN